MRVLHRGQAIGVSNPALVVYSANDRGILCRPSSLSYSISSVNSTTGAKTSVVASTVLDVVTSEVSTGRNAIAWTVPGDATLGLYSLDVSGVNESGSWSYKRRFEVVANDVGISDAEVPCLLADLRMEGVTEASLPDYRAARLILQSSAEFSSYTGNTFCPEYKRVLMHANRQMHLLLDEPVAALEKIEVEANVLDLVFLRGDYAGHYDWDVLDLDGVKVMNRHLRGVTSPDDRRNPAIVLNGRVGVGLMGLYVSGVFGWTDRDGSHDGKTPDEVTRAVVKMVMRKAQLLATDDGSVALEPFVLSESTSRQSVSYDGRRVGNGPTGDREIDSVVARYRRPIAMR